jgi:pSer/pThr/pTyr-binding forkhead associated (FHA) protein
VTADAPALEVVSGPARGTRIAPEREGLLIGRSEQGDGALGGDEELSRRHARIGRLGDGRLLVEDLGSTNGTRVNGNAVAAPTVLSTGDEVELGTTRLRVVPPGAPAAPAAQAGAEAAKAPAPPERRPALRVVAGFAPGALLTLGEGPVTLGREGAGAAALGGDPSVSAAHLRVTAMSDGRMLVEDLGTDIGTYVGDARIRAPTLASAGDRLRVGDTTLEVVEAAALPGPEGGGVSKVLGGVREVPEGLFARIGARAPVTPADVVPVALVALGWSYAVVFLVRSLAIEVFDVSEDLRSLQLYQIAYATLLPVAGNSLGFFMSFRRPSDASVVRYVALTFGLPTALIGLNLALLNIWGAKEVITTVLIVVIPFSISAPLMFRLRARVARERAAAVRSS